MAKVNYIRLHEPGTARIRGVGVNQSREFFLGAKCPDEWGGGQISSMEEVPGAPGVIRIRKSTPFKGPKIDGIDMDFDSICVVAAQWTCIDEPAPAAAKTEDPPAAKPVQQQQGQTRR